MNPPVMTRIELNKIKEVYGDDIAEFRRIGEFRNMFETAIGYFKPRIKNKTDRKLLLLMLEALRGKFFSPIIKEGGACPFLTDKGCAVYEHRPLDCKLFPFATMINPKPAASGLWLVLDASVCYGDGDKKWVKKFIQKHQCAAMTLVKEYKPDELIEYTTVNYKLPFGENARRIFLVAPLVNLR